MRVSLMSIAIYFLVTSTTQSTTNTSTTPPTEDSTIIPQSTTISSQLITTQRPFITVANMTLILASNATLNNTDILLQVNAAIRNAFSIKPIINLTMVTDQTLITEPTKYTSSNYQTIITTLYLTNSTMTISQLTTATSQPDTTLTIQPPKPNEVLISLVLNMQFSYSYDSDYASSSSLKYITFTKFIFQEMLKSFSSLSRLRLYKIDINSLKPGSVIANMTMDLISNTTMNSNNITSEVNAASNSAFGSNANITSIIVYSQTPVTVASSAQPSTVKPTDPTTQTTSPQPNTVKRTDPITQTNAPQPNTVKQTDPITQTNAPQPNTVKPTDPTTQTSTTTIKTTIQPENKKIQVNLKTSFTNESLTEKQKDQSSQEYKSLVDIYIIRFTAIFESEGFKNVIIKIISITEGSVIVNYILISIPPDTTNGVKMKILEVLEKKFKNSKTDNFSIVTIFPPEHYWYIVLGVMGGLVLLSMVIYGIINQIKLYRRSMDKLSIEHQLGKNLQYNINLRRPSIKRKHKISEPKTKGLHSTKIKASSSTSVSCENEILNYANNQTKFIFNKSVTDQTSEDENSVRTKENEENEA